MTQLAARSAQQGLQLSVEEVLADLSAGRSDDLPAARSALAVPGVRRPQLGGPSFRAAYAAATTLGAVHPALARPALARLWFTPWIHPSATRAVADLPPSATRWSLGAGAHRLRGFTAGEGPTAVLVHGWGSRATDLRHVAHALVGAGLRVVAPDLPAHGGSTGRTTDVVEMGRAVAAVLAHEAPVHAVVAHSLGFPTTVLALRDAPPPQRVVALAPGRRLELAFAAFVERMRLDAPLADELRRLVERRFGDDVWERLRVDDDLPPVGRRALVVHDVDDDEVPVSEAEAIVEAWPGARFVRTSQLGHRRLLRDGEVLRAVVEHVRPRKAPAA